MLTFVLAKNGNYEVLLFQEFLGMDQKASKDLAPRELLGNIYTAQNVMET